MAAGGTLTKPSSAERCSGSPATSPTRSIPRWPGAIRSTISCSTTRPASASTSARLRGADAQRRHSGPGGDRLRRWHPTASGTTGCAAHGRPRLGRSLAAPARLGPGDPTAAVAPERILDTLDDRLQAGTDTRCSSAGCSWRWVTGCAVAGTTWCFLRRTPSAAAAQAVRAG